MLRKIHESDLIGKTIKSVDASVVNVVKLTFTDNSVLEVWAEDVVSTSFGNIPGILIEAP